MGEFVHFTDGRSCSQGDDRNQGLQYDQKTRRDEQLGAPIPLRKIRAPCYDPRANEHTIP